MTSSEEGSRGLVVTRHLSKTYRVGLGEVEAVKDVNLVVERGESLALVGPSGCGKTTLLNLLGGLDSPTQGDVFFESRNLARLRDPELSKLRRSRIGFIFQFFNLIPNRTALENVSLPLFFGGLKSIDAEKASKAALELVGLSGRAHHYPSELSGGEQQRVAIARALVIQPSLILADEPTGNLDTATGREIVEIMLDQTKSGITIMVATHDPYITQQVDRPLHMQDGAIA